MPSREIHTGHGLGSGVVRGMPDRKVSERYGVGLLRVLFNGVLDGRAARRERMRGYTDAITDACSFCGALCDANGNPDDGAHAAPYAIPERSSAHRNS